MNGAQPPWPTATAAAEPPTGLPSPLQLLWFIWLAPGYARANHTHLSELLSQREGIEIGRSTLRGILVNAGLSSPRQRRPPKHRVRRQRMSQEGMPPFALLIAVDDATGTVVDALFCEQEDSRNYFLLMQVLMERCGRPVALYTDRHGVFRHTPGSGLPGMPTQFSRA